MGAGRQLWNGVLIAVNVAHPVTFVSTLAGMVVGGAARSAWDANRLEAAQLQYQGEVNEWFVKTGDIVMKDQTLCVVRSLKQLRGIPDQNEVVAQFDGVIVWTYPLGTAFGWTTQIVEIGPIPKPVPKPAGTPSAAGRQAAAAAAWLARGAAVAASKVARLAEGIAEAKPAASDSAAESDNSGKTTNPPVT